jgi:hypothetical protein
LDSQLQNILEETTIAVSGLFPTTWTAGRKKEELAIREKVPKLSKALCRGFNSGCRVVIIEAAWMKKSVSVGWVI